MAENEIIKVVSQLLQKSTGIINKYDELYLKTGVKFNIFKIARIHEKEVIMCRVIADLLNPRGSHYKGDIYLKLFWNIISSKSKNCPSLNTVNAKVTTEYSTDAQRRIDIVIEDGNIFIPIEAKIWAGERVDQLRDYAKYSKKKNGGKDIPVLFLTVDGKESETAVKDEYISVSFKEDIILWLEKCLKEKETETSPPIREIIKQLIEAIRSILGYSEDSNMDKEISGLIFKSEETIRAAVEIDKVIKAIDDEKWEIFKGVIFEKVKKQFPDAYICDGVDEWYAISVPIKNNEYTLYVNYDWQSITVEGNQKEITSPVEKKINKIMTALTGVSDDEIDGVWLVENKIRYPGMENIDEIIYSLLLYRKYEQNPEEAANYIVAMASELEKI